jgi:probable rRNA maturation factor
MKILNRQYRGLDRTTDVLSFPQMENRTQHSALSTQHYVLGDIVINLHKAKRQAAENGITFDEELTCLLIHGLLHLIGYDHGKSSYQKKKMESKERELLKAFKTK